MHRLLVLYPPPADPRAFADYYENHHLPIAARLPGRDSPYFCVFEADFDDAAALDAALGSPEGEATAADVPNYATGGAVLLRFDVREGDPATTGR